VDRPQAIEGNILSKIGLIALATVLILTGLSYAAGKIALTCSGTIVSAGTKEPAPNLSLVIDLDRGIVTLGSIGELSIVKRTENSVSFKGSSEDGQTVWQGDVDRFSGLTVVSVWRNKQILLHYQLICRRPEPLF
jgi:hypothetical protein